MIYLKSMFFHYTRFRIRRPGALKRVGAEMKKAEALTRGKEVTTWQLFR